MRVCVYIRVYACEYVSICVCVCVCVREQGQPSNEIRVINLTNLSLV